MPKYRYYLIENTYMVRWGCKGLPEYVKPDGTWHEYPDEWDVMTNGRYYCDNEKKAMKLAERVFDKLKKLGFEYP